MRRLPGVCRARGPAVLACVVVALLLTTQPTAAGNPISLLISNVRDTSFTVSWLTASPEVGQLQLAKGGGFGDARGAEHSGMTHYVTVTGLQPNTTYLFDVVSGGQVYDNNGAHYTVITGATLAPPTPDLIIGRVRYADGSNAADVLVVFTVQQEQSVSAPMSMLITERDQGFFHINLSDARAVKDPTHYFAYGSQTDLLTIQAIDARTTGTVRVPVSDSRLRSADPGQTVVVELSGAGQSPTLVVRQPTPTANPAAPEEETGGLVIGLVVAALVIFGLGVVAIMFVWRR